MENLLKTRIEYPRYAVPKRAAWQAAIEAACRAYMVSQTEILSACRRSDLVQARAYIVARLKMNHGWKDRELGRRLNRSHTTIADLFRNYVAGYYS